MKTKITLSFVAISSILLLISCSNTPQTVEIGKQVPNYTFTEVLNNNNQELSIQELKGKVVILEFWATWCGSCLPVMKKLDSLQAKFPNQLEIVSISTESRTRLEKYVANTNTKLKIAIDTIHQKKFPYRTIPHSIIIDKNGIVKAITNPENITEELVKKLIEGKQIAKLAVKGQVDTSSVKVIKEIFDTNKTIKLTTYKPNSHASVRSKRGVDGKINSLAIQNFTIPSLFRNLYKVPSNKRMVYSDSSLEKLSEYKNENIYCLNIEVSEKLEDEIFDLAINFVNDAFPYSAKLETDSIYCYVLSKHNNVIQPSTSEKKSHMMMGGLFEMKKSKMKKLANYLEGLTPVPVYDNTGLDGEYDITIQWEGENVQTLYDALDKYGLTIEKSKIKYPIEFLKISNK